MAAASSSTQNEITHDDDKNMEHSSKLKMKYNLDDYIVLCVNINEKSDLFQTVSIAISEDSIRMVDGVDSALSCIDSLSDSKIYVVISGLVEDADVQRLISNPQVISVRLCSTNNDKVEQLTTQLHSQIKQSTDRWPFEEKSFQQALTSASEWYHLFLLIICHHPKNIPRSYQEMFDECRSYYKNSRVMLERIEQFAETYTLDTLIREYTRDNFVYKIINRALRTQDMDIIRKFSPIITDLHHQLHESHRKYYNSNEHYIRAVYRGQYLNSDAVKYISSICKSRKPVIKLTSFTSTSINPEIALGFVPLTPDSISCLFEIIINEPYNAAHKHLHCFAQVFADVSSLSNMLHEQEVLFSASTQFCVKYVGDPVVQADGSQVLIVLELVANTEKTNSIYFDIAKRIESETDPQVYYEILDVLQANAEKEEQFQKINWAKFWNKFSAFWSTDLPYEQSLLLTIYDSFSEDRDYTRKAIEMHKTHLHPVLNSQPFSSRLNQCKGMQTIPTKGIALYEQYLKDFCMVNTKEVIDCLYFAGELYELVGDEECALQSYQQILHIDIDNQHRRNDQVKKRIEKLKKSNKPKTKQRPATRIDVDETSHPNYSAQEEQWQIFWALKSHKDKSTQKRASLHCLREYFLDRKRWYIHTDLNIVLRLPLQTPEDQSIEFYRYYSLLAIQRQVLCNHFPTDSTNNFFLSLHRYEKYMHEWMLFKRLDTFLKRFEQKSNFIHHELLPLLDQLINKLTLLITVCTVYIAINGEDDRVKVNNIPFIDVRKMNKEQLAFFDLTDGDLLTELDALHEEIQTALPTFTLSPDEERFLNGSF